MCVRSYETGALLKGEASERLVQESASVDTGAVPAYLDQEGVWQYVRPSEIEHFERHLATKVVTVFVEEA